MGKCQFDASESNYNGPSHSLCLLKSLNNVHFI